MKDKRFYIDLISKHCYGTFNSMLLITTEDLDKLAEKLSRQLEPQLVDIEDIFNNEEHQIELDNSKLLREVENLINKSVIYSKGKMLEDIRSKFSV